MTTARCPAREELYALHIGTLPEPSVTDLIEHVSTCPSCQALLETLGSAGDSLLERLRSPAVLAADPYEDEPECQAAVARVQALADTGFGIGPCPAPSAASDLGQLGEYQLLAKLGEGGMGAVYKARQVRLDKIVALKLLSKQRTGDQNAVTRFEREMRAVGRLSHVNIVQALDARDIEGTTVLVMEYVEGMDLGQAVQYLGALRIADACELVRQAAEGLQCAHENNLVHRDIKPSNLMVTGRGLVKILDLGLARLGTEQPSGSELTSAGSAMGTADYMSPEQVANAHSVDIRADIYSLGCTLFKLLTGRAPFSGPQYATHVEKLVGHLKASPPPVRLLRTDVPAELAAVIERMMAKDPAERPATAAEAAAALAPFAAGADLTRLLAEAQSMATGDPAAAAAAPGTAPFIPASSVRSPPGRACFSPMPQRKSRVRPALLAAALLTALGGAGLLLGIVLRGGNANRQETVAESQDDAPAAGGAKDALRGMIDVLIWSPGDDERHGLALRHRAALPLRANDQIRVKAELNRPAYVYLLWIDTQGVTSPVYPWKPGRWDERPKPEAPTDRLGLPQQVDRAWPMEGGPGMETLLLLARDTPLPDDFDLSGHFAGLGPQPMQGPQALVEFEGGRVVSDAKQQDRGPKFYDPQQIDDVVLRTQQRIAEKLGPHFTLIRAVSFANRGK